MDALFYKADARSHAVVGVNPRMVGARTRRHSLGWIELQHRQKIVRESLCVVICEVVLLQQQIFQVPAIAPAPHWSGKVPLQEGALERETQRHREMESTRRCSGPESQLSDISQPAPAIK